MSEKSIALAKVLKALRPDLRKAKLSRLKGPELEGVQDAYYELYSERLQ